MYRLQKEIKSRVADYWCLFSLSFPQQIVHRLISLEHGFVPARPEQRLGWSEMVVQISETTPFKQGGNLFNQKSGLLLEKSGLQVVDEKIRAESQ